MKPYVKFGILIVAIIGVLAWLAIGGVNQTKTYYKTISELQQMNDHGQHERLRVAGDVVDHSIVHNGHEVAFTLKQDQLRLKVVYAGIDPLPDTFKDGAKALADGRLGADGVFHATKVQAKCASKYEAKPPQHVVSQKASL